MTHQALEPAQLGPFTLSNHIVMAPMTRSRAPGGLPNDMMVEYYRQRASAGLIVTEGTAPAADGSGYARIPGLFTGEQVKGWKRVTEAVHEAGGHIFVQLMHTGRIFHPLNLPEGAQGVGPSPVAAAGQIWTDQQQLQPNGTPRALTIAELATVREEFVRSARRAMAAGFDGVELHGANGYLLEQFLHPSSNKRTDAYGGSVPNRARFMLEVTRAVANAIGLDRTAIRLSPWGTNGDLTHYPEIDEAYEHLASALQKLGILYVHLIKPATDDAAGARTLGIIRRLFTNTVILNRGFQSLDAIDAVLESGTADLVSVGRPFVSNPDFVQRISAGKALTAPNPATFFAPGPKGFAEGYTDYPTAVA